MSPGGWRRRAQAVLIFERLWQQTGCRHVIDKLLAGRRFEFDVERAIFLTVLHRLFDSAWRAEIIESNPVSRVRTPRVREIRKERVILTDDEFERFIA